MMANSKHAHKDKYFDTRRKILSEEMINMEALIFIYLEIKD